MHVSEETAPGLFLHNLFYVTFVFLVFLENGYGYETMTGLS